MTQKQDAIVIGAGHNGLVTAALLAKAGFKTLVLEQRDVLGGAAATEEVFPGFKINTGADDAGLFHDTIIEELNLAAYGLSFHESEVAVFAPQPDGSTLTLWRDQAKFPEQGWVKVWLPISCPRARASRHGSSRRSTSSVET